MADYLIHDSTLEDIADAIRSKTGGSSLIAPEDMPTEIASIETGGGGTEITSGIVIKELDGDLKIKKADVYLGETVPYGFANLYYSNSTQAGYFTFHGQPKIICEYAFQGFGDCSGMDTSEVTQLKTSAFRQAKNVGIKSFPKCTSINAYIFWESTSVTSLDFPLLTNLNYSSVFGRATGLQTATIGSVGHGVTAISNSTFSGDTQSGLTITIYTTGSYADTAVANTRKGATNATIIIKASEETTYNGTTYNAGDIILTSEVTS